MKKKYILILVLFGLLLAHHAYTMNKGYYCDFITKSHLQSMYEDAVNETIEKFEECLRESQKQSYSCDKYYGRLDELDRNDFLMLYKIRIVKLMPSNLKTDPRFKDLSGEYNYELLRKRLLTLRENKLFSGSSYNFKEINEWLDSVSSN